MQVAVRAGGLPQPLCDGGADHGDDRTHCCGQQCDHLPPNRLAGRHAPPLGNVDQAHRHRRAIPGSDVTPYRALDPGDPRPGGNAVGVQTLGKGAKRSIQRQKFGSDGSTLRRRRPRRSVYRPSGLRQPPLLDRRAT